MVNLLVRKQDGTTRCILPSQGNKQMITSAKREQTLMQADVITVGLVSGAPSDIAIGDNITIDGRKYRVNQIPRIRKVTEKMYESDIVFESAKYDLTNVQMLMPADTILDHYTGNMEKFLDLIVSNANRVYPGEWVAGEVPDTEYVTKSITEKNCLAALQELCTSFEDNYIFVISEAGDVKTIDVKEDGDISGVQLRYGRGRGLYSITRDATSSESVVTRLYVYGSTENLTTGYRHSRLCLPNKDKTTSYIQDNTKVALYGLKEGFANIDDVKPHSTGEVTAIVADNVLQFIDTSIDFDLNAKWQDTANDYAEYLAMRNLETSAEIRQNYLDNVLNTSKYLIDKPCVTFTKGTMEGMSFRVANFDFATHKFTLVENVENEGTDMEQHYPDPNTTAYRIAVGDTYNLTDIYLPYSFVEDAEDTLETAGNAEYAERSSMLATYSVELDPEYIVRYMSGVFSVIPGDYVRITDSDIGIDKQIKVQSVQEDLLTGKVSIQISDIRKRKKGYISNRQEFEAAVLDVNGRTMQDHTTLTCKFTPNYQGSGNKLNITSGVFVSSELTGRQQSWNIDARTYDSIAWRGEYYIFLRLSKQRNYGWAYLSPVEIGDDFPPSLEQIVAGCATPIGMGAPSDDDYYFKIGTLSAKNAHGKRTLSLIYGQQVVTGHSIIGGVIEDINGNQIVDIELGELGYVENGTRVGVRQKMAEKIEPNEFGYDEYGFQMTVRGGGVCQVPRVNFGRDNAILVNRKKMLPAMRNMLDARVGAIELQLFGCKTQDVIAEIKVRGWNGLSALVLGDIMSKEAVDMAEAAAAEEAEIGRFDAQVGEDTIFFDLELYRYAVKLVESAGLMGMDITGIYDILPDPGSTDQQEILLHVLNSGVAQDGIVYCQDNDMYVAAEFVNMIAESIKDSAMTISEICNIVYGEPDATVMQNMIALVISEETNGSRSLMYDNTPCSVFSEEMVVPKKMYDEDAVNSVAAAIREQINDITDSDIYQMNERWPYAAHYIARYLSDEMGIYRWQDESYHDVKE